MPKKKSLSHRVKLAIRTYCNPFEVANAMRDGQKYKRKRVAHWEKIRKQHEAEYRLKSSRELQKIFLQTSDGLKVGAAFQILEERKKKRKKR